MAGMLLTATVNIRDLAGVLDGPGKMISKAARMAGSDALKGMRAEASRLIRERKAIKLSAVHDALDMLFPRAGGEMIWILRAEPRPMRVYAFAARQTRAGVSVEINKGKRVLIRHAFIATMKSGHTGVFYRTGEFGRNRNPKLEKIDEAYTSRVSDVLGDVAPAVAQRGEDVFRKSFARLFR